MSGSVTSTLGQADSLQKEFFKRVCALKPSVVSANLSNITFASAYHLPEYVYFSPWMNLLGQPFLSTEIYFPDPLVFVSTLIHNGTKLCPKVSFKLAHLVINDPTPLASLLLDSSSATCLCLLPLHHTRKPHCYVT